MYHIAALLWFFNELFYDERRRNAAPMSAAANDRSNDLLRLIVVFLSAGALVFFFALSLTLIAHAAADPETPRNIADLPIPAVYYNPSFWDHPYRTAVALRLLLMNIGATLALCLLYRSLSRNAIKPFAWGVIAIAYAACAFLALHAPALESTDVYRYAVQSTLGTQAYALHLLHVPCPDPQPDAWCRQDDFTFPSLYGPLYLAALHAAVGQAPSIFEKIAMLRLAGLGWTTLFIALLFLLRIQPAIVAVAALNPILLFQYVADAHNDIIGIALVTAGILAVQRLPLLTLLLTLAASLVKFPFAFIGVLPFLRLAARPRIVWTAASVAVCAAVSWLWYGKAYMASLRLYGQGSWTTHHILAFVLALVLLGAAVSHKRIYLAGAYLFPAMSSFAPMPWYALWALPYIQWDQRKLTTFLVLLPLTTFLMSTNFVVPAFWYVILGGLPISLLLQIFRNTLPRRG
jgi:hypothetical protein